MFAGPFAFRPRANGFFRNGVIKFTFCEVIDTAPKMPPLAVKSRDFHQLRVKPRLFEVEESICTFQALI